MKADKILEYISRGRTDYIFQLLKDPNWKNLIQQGQVKTLQWFIYYNDVTALKAVLEAGGDLSSIDLDAELGNAAFFGHWKVADWLINQGAEVNSTVAETGETPLHAALSKAGRPYYLYTVRLLLEKGADVNARTMAGKATESFMRDVRTRGETPLHRAAAFADADTIKLLLEHGADKEIRDAYGDTPLSWASMHLRPGEILSLLSYGAHRISSKHVEINTSDHGHGWGSGMDWNLFGEYLPE